MGRFRLDIAFVVEGQGCVSRARFLGILSRRSKFE
jgi:hypothetical protein